MNDNVQRCNHYDGEKTYTELHNQNLNSPAGKFNEEMIQGEPGFNVYSSADGLFLGIKVTPNDSEGRLIVTLEEAAAAARFILEGIENQLRKRRKLGEQG